ncbi:transcription factor IIA, alpha/beta subunit [Mycena sanguinolenta]|nr:transcription factor IIA, alpha/beta subunit [Mycena sanguinolenta]
MSNKIVPSIYRAVIDDVIASIRPAFGEFGVPEDVLSELQSKWESKIIASRVADFDSRFEEAPLPTMPTARQIVYPHPTLPALATPLQNQNQNQNQIQTQTRAIPYVKPEGSASSSYPSSYSTSRSDVSTSVTHAQGHGGTYVTGIVDTPYGLAASIPTQYATQYTSSQYAPSQYVSPQSTGQYASQYQYASSQYTLPTLPGPSVPPLPAYPTHAPGESTMGPNLNRAPTRTATPVSVYRIPQTDGAVPELWTYDDGVETNDGDEDEAEAAPLMPSTLIKKERMAAANLNKNEPDNDEDAITSDLDDSDSDSDSSSPSAASSRGNDGDPDMIFCTYTKVARVKTKWRCVLREGVIHVGGKDWAFERCVGEFEW